MWEVVRQILCDSPPSGENTVGRGIAIEIGGAQGGDNGVFGEGGGPEAREDGGITMAEGNRGLPVVV